MAELPDFLTVREVARILRISSTTAYKEVQRFIDTGGREGIPVLLIGGQKRIPRQKLEPLAGGPIHLPDVVDTSPSEVHAVVERRDHRKAKSPQRSSRRNSGSTSELPLDVG